MRNRETYSKDPSQRKLVNEGVASVNDDPTVTGLEVLRYELETFVCDGQYARGLEHVLETYLKNLDQAQQPAVWISGFYGSGKSHLVKMLRALWVDTTFPDGACARAIANLPTGVRDQLRELATQGKRHGGLHAASGTLGSGADGSVRLALLGVIFKSLGLPEQYPLARFVMWLRSEGLYDKVRASVEADGLDWHEELDNFYVAEGLHQALVQHKPQVFSSPAMCAEVLLHRHPHVHDVGNDEMIKAVRQALTVEGRLPLTLVVLDEVQQYIGDNAQRSLDVQEAVEACCKNIGAKMLFIGTGQTAVTGTPNLKKLEGRFTIRVELSDADVDAVIRQVVLAKKPTALEPIASVMTANLGEISRHLANTRLAHRQDDLAFFAQDYPILPVRRRFWEQTLRVLDQTGTDSQLRNQLSMVHKVIQTNLDEELGHVIPADHLYFDSAERLLQARLLPRKVYEATTRWKKGDVDKQLLARACGLVFLITRLSASNKELGLRADVHTLADLLVVDLREGSSALRTRLGALLDGCDLLMKVGDEYRIQTEESAAWNDEFLNQCHQLSNEAHRIDAERGDRLRRLFGERMTRKTLAQGQSKVPREIHALFEAALRPDASEKVHAWVRDGWSIDENSVRAEARQAGVSSPTIFVFIPKRNADDLRTHLIHFKAATATLDKFGVPRSPEGIDARAAMETTKQNAEARIHELIDDAFSGARVFQGGGTECSAGDLQACILEAAESSFQRLYPQFPMADHDQWAKVYANARKGAPDALRAVGFPGDAQDHPVCKQVLAAIGPGKKGAEIRSRFDAAPHGWSGDAVDGALQVLLIAGLLRVQDERGAPMDPKELERKAMGKAFFRIEATTISTGQRIQVRKVVQQLGIQARQGEELASVPDFLARATALSQRAGGDAPRPPRPDTAALEEIRLSSGNEQLLGIYNRRDELKDAFKAWEVRAAAIEARWPSWERLGQLLRHACSLPEAEVHEIQRDGMVQGRLLLSEPDPVPPMISALVQLLRTALNDVASAHDGAWTREHEALLADPSWGRLEAEQRDDLLSRHGVAPAQRPSIRVATEADIVGTLAATSLPALRDRVAALTGRFESLHRDAARLAEPKVTFVSLPRRTMKTPGDIQAWLDDVRARLVEALEQGPVGIS